MKNRLDYGKVQIDGMDCKIIHNDIIDPFERMKFVKPGEAVRYYIHYMYRTFSGEARACYADDTANNWSV